MTVIQEGDLEFAFGSSWRVLKYDANGSYYKTALENQVKPTKAVDFLCLREGAPLLMLEVKDFSLGVPKQEEFDKVPMIVAIKARDTLAGIIGGSHNATDSSEKNAFRTFRDRLSSSPQVVFLFEDLATPNRRPPQTTAHKQDILWKQLKSHLKWLTCNVWVVGLSDYHLVFNDLTIRRV